MLTAWPLSGAVPSVSDVTYTRRLWRDLAHLGLGLPLGIVYCVLTIVLVALSIGLLPLGLLGLVLFKPTAMLTRSFATIEKARFAEVLGEHIDVPPQPRRTGLLDELRSGRNWRNVVYFALAMPVMAFCAYAIVLGLIGLGVAGLVVVPLADLLISDIGLGARLVLWAACAVLALIAAPGVARGFVSAQTVLARFLLGRGTEEELSERVETLTVSREALAAAADSERQRIERDLHDGAQQRLVALAMNLGIAKEKLADNPGAAEEYVAQAHDEAKAALAELRNLARGIHPVVLSDRGLDAALSAVAARSPVPVQVDVDVPKRPSATVEAVAYFVVTEALANVAKHSGARRAVLSVRRVGDVLHVVVTDDGHGGADPALGTGLAGLAGRVKGADGAMHLSSPAGGPTTLTVELPCAS